MRAEYTIHRLEPTPDTVRETAHDVKDVLVQDFMRFGLTRDEALDLTPDGTNANPENMMDNLLEERNEYYGLRGRDGQLGAVAALSDWLYRHEAPFNAAIPNRWNKTRHRINHKLGRPVTKRSGLHAFGFTTEHAEEDTAARFVAYLQNRTAERGHHALMAAVDTQDQLTMAALEMNGAVWERGKSLGRTPVNTGERDLLLYRLDTR